MDATQGDALANPVTQWFNSQHRCGDFTLFPLSLSCCGFEKFALKSSPGPDRREIVERDGEIALEMRARQDPESVPLVALRANRLRLARDRGMAIIDVAVATSSLEFSRPTLAYDLVPLHTAVATPIDYRNVGHPGQPINLAVGNLAPLWCCVITYLGRFSAE